ncbi:MAG TPA: long-chain fatty acid--CoA ligase [Candidatus Xenobia bacterium]
MTLSELLEARAAEHGDRPFLFWQDESLSYRELATRATRIARGLAERGIGPGDRVGIMMPNSPRYVEWLFGIWRAGAVACPINPALTTDEAGYIIEHARPALVIDAATPPGEAGERALGAHPAPDALASLIYTSGTTGRPKGVMLTHANYLWDAETTVRTIGLTAADRFLCILPLFHVNAQVVTVVCPLLAGAQTVLLPRFAPDTFLADVARYRVTYFSAVPTVYAILLTRDRQSLDLSTLRFGICGAAPMPVEVFERFEARFGIRILEGYGLSEATCVSSVNPVDGARKVGSIGLPLPGQDMRIDAPPGQVGEILVRGPNVMRGYFEDEAATAAVLKDGWLHTGDLGAQDEDGYFTIVGRSKDMIIRGGENIYPKEIEEVLHRHPDVAEAAVIGMPDAVWGETVLAVVVPRAGVPEASIHAWCEQHLAPFKRPARIVFVAAADLPRTPTGKLQKHLLRLRL